MNSPPSQPLGTGSPGQPEGGIISCRQVSSLVTTVEYTSMDTETEAAAPAVAAASNPPPLHRRVLDTLVAPGELFATFREKTPWIGALSISMAAGLAIALLIPGELLEPEAARSLGDADPQAGGAADPAEMANFMRASLVVGALVFTPILAFAAAGLVALVFNLFLGGEARYKQYLAVSTHGLLITSLGGLLTLPLQIARGDVQTQLSLSLLTPFLDRDGFLFGFLQGMNVFTLWMIVLLALGVSVLNRGRSWGSASAILLGVYAVLTSVFAGVGALMS